MKVFSGNSPTKLYYQALQEVLNNGDTCRPRGKKIKELRPVAVEFTNPLNRVTFLEGRKINPFFQIAESLWILSGRADVKWLVQFNANMKTFSDDGVFFNAPYGERLRSYGKNALSNTIYNPVDQMMDAYTKLVEDPDTRQAIMTITNPHFDNADYTIHKKGKDIGCNLVITFKIRENKLHMTVFNRSNDVHWGLWGANLCQFTTIQEVMVSWLRANGTEFENLEVGTYTQVTDSLHVYLDEYGYKITESVLKEYNEDRVKELEHTFTFKNEPRMKMSASNFESFLLWFWTEVDPVLSDDELLSREDVLDFLIGVLDKVHEEGALDDYWYMAIQSMVAYRLLKLENLKACLKLVGLIENCQFKVSMLYFLKSHILKVKDNKEEFEEVKSLWDTIISWICDPKELVDESEVDHLKRYLELEV